MTTDTRTGLTKVTDILAALTELRTREDADDHDAEGWAEFLDNLGCKDGDDAELTLLRDLADLAAPAAWRIDTDEVAMEAAAAADEEDR